MIHHVTVKMGRKSAASIVPHSTRACSCKVRLTPPVWYAGKRRQRSWLPYTGSLVSFAATSVLHKVAAPARRRHRTQQHQIVQRTRNARQTHCPACLDSKPSKVAHPMNSGDKNTRANTGRRLPCSVLPCLQYTTTVDASCSTTRPCHTV